MSETAGGLPREVADLAARAALDAGATEAVAEAVAADAGLAAAAMLARLALALDVPLDTLAGLPVGPMLEEVSDGG